MNYKVKNIITNEEKELIISFIGETIEEISFFDLGEFSLYIIVKSCNKTILIGNESLDEKDGEQYPSLEILELCNKNTQKYEVFIRKGMEIPRKKIIITKKLQNVQIVRDLITWEYKKIIGRWK